jgi:hypothetical protein
VTAFVRQSGVIPPLPGPTTGEQPDLAAEWGNSIPEQGSRVLIVDSVLPDGGVFACFASCGLGKITQWTICIKKLCQASQFSMRPMEKMRLQSSSPKAQNLATIDVGAGAFSRDVATGGAFWTTFNQPTCSTMQPRRHPGRFPSPFATC